MNACEVALLGESIHMKKRPSRRVEGYQSSREELAQPPALRARTIRRTRIAYAYRMSSKHNGHEFVSHRAPPFRSLSVFLVPEAPPYLAYFANLWLRKKEEKPRVRPYIYTEGSLPISIIWVYSGNCTRAILFEYPSTQVKLHYR